MKRPGSRVPRRGHSRCSCSSAPSLGRRHPLGSDAAARHRDVPEHGQPLQGRARSRCSASQVGKVTSVKVVGTSVQVRDDLLRRRPAPGRARPDRAAVDRRRPVRAARPGVQERRGPRRRRHASASPAPRCRSSSTTPTASSTSSPRRSARRARTSTARSSRLVKASAGALKGNGRQFQKSLGDFADALDTLSAVDGNYQHTVDQTGQLTRTLQANDKTVRRLVLSLARRHGDPQRPASGHPRRPRPASPAPSTTSRSSPRSNRGRLKGTIAGLRDVTTTLNRRIADLDDLLTLAPVGLRGRDEHQRRPPTTTRSPRRHLAAGTHHLVRPARRLHHQPRHPALLRDRGRLRERGRRAGHAARPAVHRSRGRRQRPGPAALRGRHQRRPAATATGAARRRS